MDRAYFVIEDDDRRVLGDPVARFSNPAGRSSSRKSARTIVGCSALILQPEEPRTYELAKLAVTASFQGRQLGRRLTEASITTAQTLGRNASCSPRIPAAARRRLYESLGFTYVPTAQAETFRGHYERGDTFMELSLP